MSTWLIILLSGYAGVSATVLVVMLWLGMLACDPGPMDWEDWLVSIAAAVVIGVCWPVYLVVNLFKL